MATQKFIFTGHVASIGTLALNKHGQIFEADPDWIRDQGFPAVPHEETDDPEQLRRDAEAVNVEKTITQENE